jgi:hypothetical protein
MLKTVEYSTGKKTRGLAVTYRAGDGEKYGTCPVACALNCSGKGAQEIDAEYLDALLDAVPTKGISFTYTHFPWSKWSGKLGPGKAVINYSADTFAAADAAPSVPTVIVVPTEFWEGKKAISRGAGKRTIVRCPEEYRDGLGCANCGNGEPLCARLDRNFIVGFTAHGSGKKKAADPETRGGCYADSGNVRLHWRDTANQAQPDETDGEKLKRFAKSLPPRSILRHHIAGDIGAG